MPSAPRLAFAGKTLAIRNMVTLVMVFALILRVLSYCSGRALWVDEAMVSLNIIHDSLPQLLLKPMLYFQVAPLGFLAIEKALVSGLGSSEAVLRLFPFLCGLASLGLFYRLSQKTRLGATAFLVAIAGFAVSRGLVYYAGEVKQYASDVLVTLSLLLLAYRVMEQPGQRKPILYLGIAGILAVWFAYPAFFVLLGLGLALLALLWRQNDRRGVIFILICLLAWCGSMGLYFTVALESIRASSAHQAIWRSVWDKQLSAFMPPIYTVSGWQWLVKRTVDTFKYPVGSQVQMLAALVFLAGLLSMVFQQGKANRPYLWLLAAPILTATVASALHLYPYTGRLVLFLVPSYLLLMAAGLDVIAERFKAPPVLISLLGVILIVPSLFSSKLYISKSEEIKPVLQYIQEQRRPDDAALIYYGAQPALAYYANRYHLPTLLGSDYQDYLNGMERRSHEPETQRYVDAMLATASKRHTRLWFVVSHLHGREGKDYLGIIGRKAHLVSSYRYSGAGAYLFQFPQ